MIHTLALWGLVTNNGEGGYKQQGGVNEFFFSRAEGGGGTKSFEVVLTWKLEI